DDDLGPNDQRRIVDSIIGAHGAAELPLPRRPWLDELPTVVDLSSLPAENDESIAFALADVPEHQRQDPATFVPDRDGSMLIYGSSGSGKSTLLKTLAIGAGRIPQTGGLEVYCIDFASGALGGLTELPYVGSVVDGDDA